MKRLLLILCLLMLFSLNISATEFTAPEVPKQAEKYFPESQQSFVQDLWYIIKSVIADVYPDLTDAAHICLRIIAIILLGSLLNANNENYRKDTLCKICGKPVPNTRRHYCSAGCADIDNRENAKIKWHRHYQKKK